MSLTDDHTDADGAKCLACGETHFERARGGDFADYCEECATRKCACGDVMDRDDTTEVDGVVYCKIMYGAYRTQPCECADQQQEEIQ